MPSFETGKGNVQPGATRLRAAWHDAPSREDRRCTGTKQSTRRSRSRTRRGISPTAAPKVGDGQVGRFVFEPGWRWSNDVKPIAKTESCQAPHFQYHVSGRLAIRMDDGTEFVAGPGDITSLPSGHDAWVVGDEPAVVVDWVGATKYAKG
jgi:hypothetical protein